MTKIYKKELILDSAVPTTWEDYHQFYEIYSDLPIEYHQPWGEERYAHGTSRYVNFSAIWPPEIVHQFDEVTDTTKRYRIKMTFEAQEL